MARASPGLKANDIRDGDLDAACYKAFEYRHLGSLAYIGNSAVFDLGAGWSVSGGLWAVYAWAERVLYAEREPPDADPHDDGLGEAQPIWTR